MKHITSKITSCLQQCQAVLCTGRKNGLIWMLYYFVILTANDSWPQLKACLGSVRSVIMIRPVGTTQYFFERFALMLYEELVFLGES